MNINKKIYVSEVTISCACVQVDSQETTSADVAQPIRFCVLCCRIFAPKAAKVRLPMKMFPSILSLLWALRYKEPHDFFTGKVCCA